MLQPKLLKHLLAVLNDNHIQYMATGSIVSSIQGQPRATHDVDILINIPVDSITGLIKAFPPPQFYLSEEGIKDAILHRGMFNLLDTTEGDKYDFWILTDEPFDKSRFERKFKDNIFGFEMYISTPEDTILAKLKWTRLSGGSEKHMTDALRVYEINHWRLDIDYIEKWVSELMVDEYWNKLKELAKPII